MSDNTLYDTDIVSALYPTASSTEQQELLYVIKRATLDLGNVLEDSVPPSAARDRAMEKLQEMLFWWERAVMRS